MLKQSLHSFSNNNYDQNKSILSFLPTLFLVVFLTCAIGVSLVLKDNLLEIITYTQNSSTSSNSPSYLLEKESSFLKAKNKSFYRSLLQNPENLTNYPEVFDFALFENELLFLSQDCRLTLSSNSCDLHQITDQLTLIENNLAESLQVSNGQAIVFSQKQNKYPSSINLISYTSTENQINEVVLHQINLKNFEEINRTKLSVENNKSEFFSHFSFS